MMRGIGGVGATSWADTPIRPYVDARHRIDATDAAMMRGIGGGGTTSWADTPIRPYVDARHRIDAAAAPPSPHRCAATP